MVHYVIISLLLLQYCETLLADDSFTPSNSCFASMTANQQHNNQMPQVTARFNAGRIPLRMEAGKSFFESLNDNRAYHCFTQNKMTASSKNQDSRHGGSATVHEPSREATDGIISYATENTAAKSALKRFDTTGCSVVSAATFDLENCNRSPAALTPVFTTDQAGLSSLTKTNYHHSSHRLYS